MGGEVDRQNPPSGYVNIQVQKKRCGQPVIGHPVFWCPPDFSLASVKAASRSRAELKAFRGGMLRSSKTPIAWDKSGTNPHMSSRCTRSSATTPSEIFRRRTCREH